MCCCDRTKKQEEGHDRIGRDIHMVIAWAASPTNATLCVANEFHIADVDGTGSQSSSEIVLASVVSSGMAWTISLNGSAQPSASFFISWILSPFVAGTSRGSFWPRKPARKGQETRI